MTTESEIKIYETDGQEVKGLDYPRMKIKNHWNLKAFVVIEIDGKSHTVEASELTRSIENATNAHSF